MRKSACAATLVALLFFALCGKGYTLSVTLVDEPSAEFKALSATAKQPVVLTFGSNRVVIHDEGFQVPGKTLAYRDIPSSSLYLVRDLRAFSQRTEYETLYTHGPFQVAIVQNPKALEGVKRVGIRPITANTVVTQEVSPEAGKADSVVTSVLGELDQERYEEYLTMLAGDSDLPTRYACSSDALTARNTIIEAFEEIDLDQLQTNQSFPISADDCEWDCTQKKGFNVIGIKKGKTRPNDYYVVGAHYDSINDSTTPCDKAPGANDNASGVAGVLELANVFNEFDTEASIVFVAFGGEEIDLLGSYKYVKTLVSQGKRGNIKAFVVLDMISYYKSASLQKIYVEGGKKNAKQKAAVNKIVSDTKKYTKMKVEYSYDFESEDHGNSDHVPFLEALMPGALIIQWDSDYKYLHTANDKVKYQKPAYAIEILKVAAATLTQAGVLLK